MPLYASLEGSPLTFWDVSYCDFFPLLPAPSVLLNCCLVWKTFIVFLEHWHKIKSVLWHTSSFLFKQQNKRYFVNFMAAFATVLDTLSRWKVTVIYMGFKQT